MRLARRQRRARETRCPFPLAPSSPDIGGAGETGARNHWPARWAQSERREYRPLESELANLMLCVWCAALHRYSSPLDTARARSHQAAHESDASGAQYRGRTFKMALFISGLKNSGAASCVNTIANAHNCVRPCAISRAPSGRTAQLRRSRTKLVMHSGCRRAGGRSARLGRDLQTLTSVPLSPRHHSLLRNLHAHKYHVTGASCKQTDGSANVRRGRAAATNAPRNDNNNNTDTDHRRQCQLHIRAAQMATGWAHRAHWAPRTAAITAVSRRLEPLRGMRSKQQHDHCQTR